MSKSEESDYSDSLISWKKPAENEEWERMPTLDLEKLPTITTTAS